MVNSDQAVATLARIRRFTLSGDRWIRAWINDRTHLVVYGQGELGERRPPPRQRWQSAPVQPFATSRAAEDQPDEVAARGVLMAVGLLSAWTGSGSVLRLLRAHREPSQPGRSYENDRLAARLW